MTIRLGLQIPNYGYPGTVADLFPTVLAQVREAESAGFDAAFLMDHFHRLHGTPDGPMLEAYTALAGLASATNTIQLGALVTGNTYRNPPMLAKTVTTLDVVSGGRAVLGIGAGWFEPEHRAYGYEFGTVADRFARLGEALAIIEPMLRGKRPTVEGNWYRVDEAINEPRIRDDLPILIGGGGERKTFGYAARFADHLNIVCGASEIPRKVAAIDQRCREVGRDRSTLEVSYLAAVFIDEDGDRARAIRHDRMLVAGQDLDAMSDRQRAKATDKHFVGDPDEVAEQIQRRVLDHGVDGVVIHQAANGHVPGVVALAGRALAPLVH